MTDTPETQAGVNNISSDYRELGYTCVMRATPVLLFLAPCVIAANQPTFTYAVPANTTVAAMAVDAAGNTYLTGSTSSSTFPATAGALQTQFSGGTCGTLPAFHGGLLMFPCTDAFVIKLDPAGNVLFATYFGGNGSQTVASAICVDASGNVYLGGTTGPNSMGQPDTFPVTAGAAFTNLAGGGFVAKLNSSGTALVYSTLLPVSPPVALAIDPAGEVYIASTTAGALPFPTTPGAFQSTPSYPDGSGVVAKLNASGSALLYATYLSGNGLTCSASDRHRRGGRCLRRRVHAGGRFSGHAGSISNRLLSERAVHGVRDQAESPGNGLGLFHISRRHDQRARRT